MNFASIIDRLIKQAAKKSADGVTWRNRMNAWLNAKRKRRWHDWLMR